jgi:glycosyltransferase involved in cell wall biosynthesis
MLEFMSCGRPVILGVNGQAGEILEQCRSDIYVEPENFVALCEAIRRLQQQDRLRNSMGSNGREYIVHNLSRERTAADYLKVLNRLLFRKARAKEAVAA